MTEMVDADHNENTPILSSNLNFVHDKENEDEQVRNRRRTTFDRFQAIVESLSALDSHQVSLIWHSDREVNHSGVVPIKSLLFHVQTSAGKERVPIVVVVPSASKVDMRNLEAHLEQQQEDNHDERLPTPRVSCSLVPTDKVEAICGFPPQSVPPLGHIPHTLRILVDETLYLQKEDTVLLGGGGHPRVGCLIAAKTLLQVEGTELANLVASTSTGSNTSTMENSTDNTLEFFPYLQKQQSTTRIKPYFPLAPPPLEQVQNILAHPDRPNPLQPQPFTFVGRINGIRRMARRLVFCDVAPPDYVGTGTKLDSFDLPWKSALDQQDHAVQIIAGKTFCKTRGDGPGAEALKTLKVGQLILVEGKTNVGNKESLQHWVEKRSFDIVVFDYRLLEEAPPRESPAQLLQQSSNQPKVEKRQLSPYSHQPHHRPVALNPDDCLKLSDVFTTTNANADSIKVVDNKEAVLDFQQSLHSLSSADTTCTTTNGDSNHAPILTGLDCEWKPKFMLDSPVELQPVLLLQISLQPLSKVYLFDLQTLLRPCLDPLEAPTELEQATSDALGLLFGSSRFLKLGFQVSNDLQRLAGSYPHIQAFRSFVAVTEVGTIAKTALQIGRINKSRHWTNSLSRLTEYLLEKPINKEQQISDWSTRPLSTAQLEYAALDAAVTPVLLTNCLELVGAHWQGELQVGRDQNDSAFATAVSSVRFMFMECDTPASVRKLKAQKIVSNQWIVTQSWVTGRDEPALPLAPTTDGGPYVDTGGILRVPTGHLTVRNSHPNSCGILLEDLIGDTPGKSKDKCLEALLTGNPDFPAGAKLEYYQRSGYVEFDDCVALFVNSPIRPGDPIPRGGRYPNMWLEDGKFMTWFLRENEWQDGSSQLARKLRGHDPSSSINQPRNEWGEPSCVLFVRMGKGDFLCCGRCRVTNGSSSLDQKSGSSTTWGLLELQLELVDWSKLQSVPYFVSMASTRVGGVR